jgi:hypothetical protein
VDAFGYLYSTSYIAAQSSMQAKDGSIRTGEPSSTYGNGDIVATSDLRADDEVIAKEGVEGEAGTGSWGVYGSKGSNYGYLGGSSAMST